MNSQWLQYAPTANKFKQTYVRGFMDISGNTIIRNGGLNIVNGNINIGTNLDVNANGHIKGNLTTDHTIYAGSLDISNSDAGPGLTVRQFANQAIATFYSDNTMMVSINDIGDVSMNRNLNVGGNIVLSGSSSITGISKSMVGLSNVDNTSDANKPVSTAQQTALDLKANLASPTFSGTITVPESRITNTTISSSTSSGALQVIGGVGIGGSVNIGGNTHIVGALTVDGSLNITGTVTRTDITSRVYISEQVDISNTGTGPGLVVRQFGIQPIAKFYDDANLILTIEDGGDVSMNQNLKVGGIIQVLNTTVSTSTSSGALQVAGGAGIGGNLYIGGTTVGINSTMVGLSNVDNTTDANKPVSTAQQTALDLKANLASPTFTGTVSGITSTMVGLSNVDNTSDANKPVSTAQQTALNSKANLASPTFTGIVTAPATSITNSTISTSTSSGALQVAGGAGIGGNLHIGGTTVGITSTMVGLGNVTNTSDANKPVSTAQQTALDLKANLASPTFTGTVSGITSAMVGLGNVNNTSDANKPVSTAQQTALDLKANLASPIFTGTVSGISSTMVGLGNVTNTSDANKPVSTAQQTALNLKANLASPTFTGTVTAPATSITNTTISTSTTTGALIVSGGAGIGGNLHIGGTTTFTGNIVANALTITPTELGYIDGATSNIQTQLNARALDNAVVKISEAQTITGAKTFTTDLVVNSLTNSSLELRQDTNMARQAPEVAVDYFNSFENNITRYADRDWKNTGGFTIATHVVPTHKITLGYNDDIQQAYANPDLTVAPTGQAIKFEIAPYNNTSLQETLKLEPDKTTMKSNNIIKYEQTTTGTTIANNTIAINGATTFNTVVSAPATSPTLDTHLTSKAYVDLRALDADVVHKGLTETISGDKSFTGTVSGITSTMVGLGNVTNTSDVNKPVSTAQQTALNLKANLASPTFTGTVSGISSNMVGLGNVTNTSDANKPVSTAQQTALNLKANLASPTFTGTVTAPATSITNTTVSTSTTTGALIVSGGAGIGGDLYVGGTTVGITSTMVGLGNVTNTSDANKQISTAQQTALDLKANLASPTFTGTVTGITKDMVGLTNVDNTTDAAKQISTAQQTALDLKANLESPTLIGNVVVTGDLGVSRVNITSISSTTLFGYNAGFSNTTGAYNTMIGNNAGFSNTTGTYNTMIGYEAGYSNTAGRSTMIGFRAGKYNTTGSFNTMIGYSAGTANTTGYSNMMFGYYAGRVNTTGYRNTMIGFQAGSSNTTAFDNTMIGYEAGSSSTTGSYNTMIGYNAGTLNTTGYGNMMIGYNAGYNNTSAFDNTMIGYSAGMSNTTGSYNTMIGYDAGWSNTTGYSNMMFGYSAGYYNLTGITNTMIGYFAGYNTTVSNNTMIGYEAGYTNSTGTENTMIGYTAGRANSSGSFNTMIGYEAGKLITTGTNNTFLGYKATSSGVTTHTNSTALGNGAIITASNNIVLGNSAITTLRCQVQNITTLSDARDKTNIRPLDEGLDFICKLKPVRFDWNMRCGPINGKVGIEECGFIAQDILEMGGKSIPNLVDDSNPEEFTVAIGYIIPVLVKSIKELRDIINAQQLQINQLLAHLA